MRSTINIIITTLLLVVVSFTVDFDELFGFQGHIKIQNLLVCGCLAFFSLLLSSLRFGLLNRSFGIVETWRRTHRLNVLSVCYSLIAVPTVAQIIGRLRHADTDRPEVLVSVSIIEKVISGGLLLLISFSLAYYEFGKSVFPAEIFLAALLLLVLAVFFGLIGCKAFFPNSELSRFKETVRAVFALSYIPAVVCSFLMHVAIIFGYIVIALSFESSLSIATLASGFSLVVLATAMPIGFGGWGVREASAAGVFAFYGLPVDIGVFSALIYGLVHLAVLGVNSLWAVSKTRRKPNDRQLPIMSHLASDYYWKTGLIAFVALLPFQLRVPTLSNSITLNLADPMAFLLGGSLVAFLHARGLLGSLWRRNSMWFGLGSFLMMIVYGWTVGYIRFGSNDWATANRLLGLIAIFSYLFAGASLACFADSVFIRRWSLIGSMVLGLTGWVQLLTSQSFAEFGMSYFNWLGMLSGFYQDRNAFSFICVSFLAIILLPSDPKISSKLEPFRVTVLIAGCLIFLIIYSGSRSGWGGLVVVVLFALFGNRRIVLNSVSLGVLLVGIFLAFRLAGINSEGDDHQFATPPLGERIKEGVTEGLGRGGTWLWGGKLFREYPVLGGGLGCTIDRGAPQVLHNAPLWAMAEMGLVGLALLLVLPFVVFKEILRDGWRGMNEQARQLLCFAILWGGYSLVQDIVYQRAMWFFLGLLMCRNVIVANPANATATGLCPKSDTSS